MFPKLVSPGKHEHVPVQYVVRTMAPKRGTPSQLHSACTAMGGRMLPERRNSHVAYQPNMVV